MMGGMCPLARILDLIGENVVAKVFGTKNDREIKRLGPPVQAINALEAEMQKLSDDQLRAKTEEFRRRIQERLSPFPRNLRATPIPTRRSRPNKRAPRR